MPFLEMHALSGGMHLFIGGIFWWNIKKESRMMRYRFRWLIFNSELLDSG